MICFPNTLGSFGCAGFANELIIIIVYDINS